MGTASKKNLNCAVGFKTEGERERAEGGMRSMGSTLSGGPRELGLLFN